MWESTDIGLYEPQAGLWVSSHLIHIAEIKNTHRVRGAVDELCLCELCID